MTKKERNAYACGLRAGRKKEKIRIINYVEERRRAGWVMVSEEAFNYFKKIIVWETK